MKKIKKKAVYKKIIAGRYGVQYSEMQLRSLTDEVKKHLPYTCYKQIVIPEKNNQCFLINQDDWERFIQALDRKLSLSIFSPAKFGKQFNEAGIKYLKMARRTAKLNFKKSTNGALKKIYLQYQQSLLQYSALVWFSFFLNLKIERELRTIEAFFESTRKISSGFSQLQREIWKFKGELPLNKIHKLYLKYRWLPCLDIHHRPWQEEEFRNQIKSFKTKRGYSANQLWKILRDLEVQEKHRLFLEMSQKLVGITDARNDFRRKGKFCARIFFKEIAQRMDIGLEDLSFLQEKEIITFLEKGRNVPIEIISQRKKGFVLYFDKNKNIICRQGKLIPETLKKLEVNIEKKKAGIIKGIPASSGKAKEEVVIVKSIADLKKIKKGNIMIAVITYPDFVPAMQKAGAIVTDLGGILSHAAIVSREFNIPCIVGTGNATKILKDGDLVEADAEKGIVRKIE